MNKFDRRLGNAMKSLENAGMYKTHRALHELKTELNTLKRKNDGKQTLARALDIAITAENTQDSEMTGILNAAQQTLEDNTQFGRLTKEPVVVIGTKLSGFCHSEREADELIEKNGNDGPFKRYRFSEFNLVISAASGPVIKLLLAIQKELNAMCGQ